MPLFDAVADLPLLVDGYELEPLAPAGMRFDRSLVRLHGGGQTGLGEDVTYDKQTTDDRYELQPQGTLR